ncbi:MAG: sulfatase-like hydrolase/transferase, partial [Gammaproteobacteria bacterium]
GYGGATPAAMPNIAAIADEGVRFHNLWSMPACSNGRAALLTGRYPLRTHVMTAIGNNDLANYMVNPNEMTLPKLLGTRGYKSALFGKFHMGLQGNDPYGYRMVHAFGFDYYNGWLDVTGDPSSIDTTAGGVAPRHTWSCGFVGDAEHGGADAGACYAADNTCQELIKSGLEAPGRICRDSGGIFNPDKLCTNRVPARINFNKLSGHYVSPLVITYANGSVTQVPPTDIRARTYRGVQVVDAAVNWINRQPAGQPWLAVVSFATDHTPLEQPPSATLPQGQPDASNLDCANPNDQRILSNLMEESMDHEIGHLLVATGIARYGRHGNLVYDPRKSNTYVLMVSDNGSLATVVKPPFDPSRAKSTAYQTGVWNPGIVAGPGIVDPGRVVNHMVNVVDFYQLIGELAGIDVHKAVPRTLDSQSMLPYLENPEQSEIRTTNFTEIGTNRHAHGVINGPCVYNATTCTQIAPTKGVCHDNNGVWYGPNPDTSGAPVRGFGLCCQVAVWQHDHGETVASNIYPLEAYAVRNDHYKIVVNKYAAYDAAANACAPSSVTELYQINEHVPAPELDTAGGNLLATGMPPLTPRQQQNYNVLHADLDTLLASQPACPWDINLDGIVNQKDVQQWAMFKRLSKGQSSWADINQDGKTNKADLDIIEEHMGPCPAASEAKTAVRQH